MSTARILFVNLDRVEVATLSGVLTTHTNALLLEEGEVASADSPTRVARLRGFLADASLPTFDLSVPGFDHELVTEHEEDGAVCVASLRIRGLRGRVTLCSGPPSELGIRAIRLPTEMRIGDVWGVLAREVAASWSDPYIPMKYFVDADAARRILGVRKIRKEVPPTESSSGSA